MICAPTYLCIVCREGFPSERVEAALHRVELATKHQSSNFGLGLITVNIVKALLLQPALDQKKGFFSDFAFPSLLSFLLFLCHKLFSLYILHVSPLFLHFCK